MKYLLILLLFITAQASAQRYMVQWGDTLFMKNMETGDSTMMNLPTGGSTGKTLTTIGNRYAWTAPTSPYLIPVQALTSSPADNVTTYFGMLPKALVTAAGISKIYIRKAGTIKIAEIYCYSGTAGTAEAWALSIRKNNTTDYLIATVAAATNERVFTNSNLSIPVIAGDYIEIKSVQPTYATNPLTSIFSGFIIIE